MLFEFREYCFIKWKFKFWNFQSENSISKWKFWIKHFRWVEVLARSIEMVKKKSRSFCLVRSLVDSYSINWKEHSIYQKNPSINRNSKAKFSAKFFRWLFGKVEEVSSLLNGLMKHYNSLYTPFDEI